MKKDSATVVVEANSLFAWSVNRTNLSPLLNVPAGISISPATSPWSFVFNLDTPDAKIPLVLATIEPIVPLALLVTPVTTFPTANPIAEFVILRYLEVIGEL